MKKILLNKVTIITLVVALMLNMVVLTGAWFGDSACTTGQISFGGLEFSVEPSVTESGYVDGRIMPGDTLELELTYAVTGDDAWIRIVVGAFIDQEVDFECLIVELHEAEAPLYLIAGEIPGVFYLQAPVLKDVLQTAHLSVTFPGDLYCNEYQYDLINYFLRVDAVQHRNIETLEEAIPIFDTYYCLPEAPLHEDFDDDDDDQGEDEN